MVVGRFLGGSSSTCKMVTTNGALAAGSARQPGDAGSRWTIGVADEAEVVDSRHCREIGSASSEKLRGLVVLPSNKPLQRSRRREIRVTSTNRSSGARAAERQGVRQADTWTSVRTQSGHGTDGIG
jgi:hypothetical protein